MDATDPITAAYQRATAKRGITHDEEGNPFPVGRLRTAATPLAEDPDEVDLVLQKPSPRPSPLRFPLLPSKTSPTSPDEWGSGEGDLPSCGEDEGATGEGTLLSALLARTSLPSAAPGYKVTPVDEEYLLWLFRVRYATARQLLKKFGAPGALEGLEQGTPEYEAARRYYKDAGIPTTEAGIRWRMDRLRKAGLIAHEPSPLFSHGFYLPTRKAKQVLGVALTVPQMSDALLRHTSGLVDLVTMFEAEGYQVVTEAEMKSVDKGSLERLFKSSAGLTVADLRIPLPPRAKKTGKYDTDPRDSHLPDMMVWRDKDEHGEWLPAIAVELELAQKDSKILTRTMIGYRDAIASGLLAHVAWYVTRTTVRDQIQAAADLLGMTSEHVQVLRHRP